SLCVSLLIICVLFFFSSRRRHTRFSRDWSSDVCSSDLSPRPRSKELYKMATVCFGTLQAKAVRVTELDNCGAPLVGGAYVVSDRSEERRVGKECRSGCSPCHAKERRVTTWDASSKEPDV